MNLGPLIIGIAGHRLSAQEKEILVHPLIGGVILFSRNYQNPEQLQALTEEIKALQTPPLLITVDQEGGRVQRFVAGFTRLPSMGSLGSLYSADPQAALAKTQAWGFCMAQELLNYNIDLSFGPVLDLDKKAKLLIGDRSFHQDPKIVIDLAGAWIAGMHAAGMRSCGKHFPGHGSVGLDSHHDLPIDPRSYAALINDDLLPFSELIRSNVLDSIMPAHILFPEVDSNPVGFSSRWVKDILRQELGFQGIIITDDLGMGGAEGIGFYPQRLEVALNAGCDLALLCNEPDAVQDILQNLSVPEAWNRTKAIASLYAI